MTFKCSPCRGTGRKKLRKRARGRGRGGRYGPCPYCKGFGYRSSESVQVSFDVPELTPEMLRLFFYGDQGPPK